jgi:hypothetical protein
MRNRHNFVLGLIFCMVNLAACKLDPPIFPKKGATGTKGTTGVTGSKGITGSTGTTDTIPPAFFTGDWYCENDKFETYTQTGQLLSSDYADVFYYEILFSSDSNNAVFLQTSNDPFPVGYNYDTYSINGQTYIEFGSDPFVRSANKPVELVSQDDKTMVWLIIDPQLHNTNGVYTYTANRLFLLKKQ